MWSDTVNPFWSTGCCSWAVVSGPPGDPADGASPLLLDGNAPLPAPCSSSMSVLATLSAIQHLKMLINQCQTHKRSFSASTLGLMHNTPTAQQDGLLWVSSETQLCLSRPRRLSTLCAYPGMYFMPNTQPRTTLVGWVHRDVRVGADLALVQVCDAVSAAWQVQQPRGYAWP